MRLRWRVLMVGEHYMRGFSAGYLGARSRPPRGVISSRAYWDGVYHGSDRAAVERWGP